MHLGYPAEHWNDDHHVDGAENVEHQHKMGIILTSGIKYPTELTSFVAQFSYYFLNNFLILDHVEIDQRRVTP